MKFLMKFPPFFCLPCLLCLNISNYNEMGVSNTKRVSHAQVQLVVRHSSGKVSMWDLWWAKRHWKKLYSETFGIPMSVSFDQFSVLVFHSYTVDARVLEKDNQNT